MEEQLTELYANPRYGLVGATKFFNNIKSLIPSISLSDVKKFLKKQSVYQIHTTIQQPKHFYPLMANDSFDKLQADLLDVSKDSHKNDRTTFLLVVIDVFSRYAYVEPLKKKTKEQIIMSMKKILEKVKPKVLTTDAGSEFIANEFGNLMIMNGIDHKIAEVGDHHKMGIVERFNKTLRGMIEKYKTIYGQRWIDNLQAIVENYNNSTHKGINSTPSNPDKEYIKKTYEEKIKKYEANEPQRIPIGANVRYVLNRGAFSKGSEPRLSKTIHTVISRTLGDEYLLSNNKLYKNYQLLQVPFNTIETDEKKEDEKEDEAKEIEDLPKKSRVFLNKEGIALNNRRNGLRERAPNYNVISDRYGKVKY